MIDFVKPLSGFLLFALSASASAYVIPTQQELLMLPPYCRYVAVIRDHYVTPQNPLTPDAETAQYMKRLKDSHHYCFGLMHLNRAYAAKTRDSKEGNLNQAIKEFDYVLNGMAPDHVMLPELLTNKAITLMLLKNEGAAVADFKKVIALKPDYPQPYAQLSDYYEGKGKKDMALKVLEEGLTHNPEVKSLLNRYRRLGGTKVFTAPEMPAKMVFPPEVSGGYQQKVDPPPTQSVPQPLVAPTPAETQADKTNPYCRFCP